jgi:hypothetical protein
MAMPAVGIGIWHMRLIEVNRVARRLWKAALHRKMSSFVGQVSIPADLQQNLPYLPICNK